MFPSLIHMLFTFAHLYFERARLRTRNGNQRLVQEQRWGSAKTAVQRACAPRRALPSYRGMLNRVSPDAAKQGLVRPVIAGGIIAVGYFVVIISVTGPQYIWIIRRVFHV
jgi:hypothetical protein